MLMMLKQALPWALPNVSNAILPRGALLLFVLDFLAGAFFPVCRFPALGAAFCSTALDPAHTGHR